MSIPTEIWHNNKVKLGTVAAASVYADSNPAPVADPSGRDGWLFDKSAATDKFNYYFYGEGTNPMTLGEFGGAWFTAHVDNYVNTSSVPFITVYTKPTGAGDAGAWYRTRRVYACRHDTEVTLGMALQYNTEAINPAYQFPYHQTHLSVLQVTGPNLDTEEILTMAVHSDSGSELTTQILVTNVGFYRKNNVVHSPNIYLSS